MNKMDKTNREKPPSGNSEGHFRTALITGGTRGIGLGIARELGNAGFSLAVNGVRPQESVQSVLDELKGFGNDVIYVQGDLSKDEERENIYRIVTGRFNRLNVLVNNAGIAPRERKDILEATPEIFDEVMEINLKGPYFLTQRFANHMVRIRNEDPLFECCIINVSSISATVASVNRGEYCISKAGIAMATKLWAARLGEYNIPVYEIRPGVIATDMTEGVKEKYDRMFEQGLSIQKRWGMPEDVGKVAVAMATGLLPYSTGQTVMVDGGLTVMRL